MVVLVAFGSVYSTAPTVVGLKRPSVSMSISQTGSMFVNIDCIWIVDSIDSVAINESPAQLYGIHCCRTGSFISMGVSHIGSAFGDIDRSWTVGSVVSIVV